MKLEQNTYLITGGAIKLTRTMEEREHTLAEGLEKGRAEGEKSGVIKTARNLKALGMPTATIMQATGLSAEDIERL